jgi:hypothetical protein
MQSYRVCAELGAVLGAGIHARMGSLPGAGPALWAGGGGVGDSDRINAIAGARIFAVRECHGFGCCGQFSPGQHALQSSLWFNYRV